MNHALRNKKRLFFLIALIACFSAATVIFFNSFNLLIGVIEVLDKPSKLHTFFLSRVYRIADDSDIQRFINNIEDNKYQGSINSYIRIASVVGGNEISSSLNKLYINLQNNKPKTSTLFYTINALGLSGNVRSAAILKRALANPQNREINIPQHILARSIYLLTGDRVSFINIQNNKEKLHINSLYSHIRKIVNNSKGRDRSFEERLILDKLFQPPER